MKKITAVACAGLMMAGCAKSLDTSTPDRGNVTYSSYGLLNAAQYRSDRICYGISLGNVIWSVILIETIIAPIYFFGFSIMNPVRMKSGPNDTCGS